MSKKHKKFRDDTVVLEGVEYNLQFLNFCDLLEHIGNMHESGIEFCSKKPNKTVKGKRK